MLSSEKAKHLVSEKLEKEHQARYTHILGVVEMAPYLAQEHHVDEEKAKTAAYFHDYCKYDSFEEIEKSLSEEEINECRQYDFLYHAYGSAYAYKRLFAEDFDEEIFSAIYHHVFGRVGMTKLEEIIFIADYTEKNRTYEDCIECRKLLFEHQYLLALDKCITYMIETSIRLGFKPHPTELLVKAYYDKMLKENKE